MAKSKAKNVEVLEEAEPTEGALTIPPTHPPAKPARSDVTDWTGEALRRVREASGLTLKQLSERTKISVPILNALEEEAFASMPNARVYVRGFVRCLARELGLELDAVSKSYVPRWERWDAKRRG